MYTIYRARNNINGKSYIGFDKNWPKRKQIHKANSQKNFDYALYKAIRKYGWENFEWFVIYESDDLNHTKNYMENYYIVEYNSHISRWGYNMTWGGEGRCSPITEDHKKKIGKANMGRKFTEEHRKKISDANKGKKKHFSEEHKKNISESHKGKQSNFKGKNHSDEAKKKISEARKNIAYRKNYNQEPDDR